MMSLKALIREMNGANRRATRVASFRVRSSALASVAWAAVALGCSGNPASVCPEGYEGCTCAADERCLTGLICASGRCVDLSDILDAGETDGTDDARADVVELLDTSARTGDVHDASDHEIDTAGSDVPDSSFRDVRDTCGPDVVGRPCGECGSGTFVCESGVTLCRGDLGVMAHNSCGGCSSLDGEPGDPCDGIDADACDDDVLLCASGDLICSDGEDSPEVCDNGIDDDCNGVADRLDPACAWTTTSATHIPGVWAVDLVADPTGGVFVVGGTARGESFDVLGVPVDATRNSSYLLNLDDGLRLEWMRMVNLDRGGWQSVGASRDGIAFVTGTYLDSFSFGGVEIRPSRTPPEAVHAEAIVAKFSATGAETLAWEVAAETQGTGPGASAVAIGGLGNVYAAMSLTAENVVVAPELFGESRPELQRGRTGIALLSFSGDLRERWARIFVNSEQQFINDVVGLPTGGACIAGGLRGQIELAGVTVDAGFGHDMFWACFDAAGSLSQHWTTRADPGVEAQATGIAVRPDGGTCISGIFRGGSGGGTLGVSGESLPASRNNESLVACFTADGELSWLHHLSSTDDALLDSITVNSSGDVTAAGRFEGRLELGAREMVATASWDALAYSLNRSGVPIWEAHYASNGQDRAIATYDRDDRLVIGVTHGAPALEDFEGEDLPTLNGAGLLVVQVSPP